MEGPYRDLGAGFARLGGPEGLRRTPTKGTLRYVEDALFELLRNSRDAGARNVYVASSLRSRRYRHLVVVDDGTGIPKTHEHLVFEPGVTTRHLSPVLEKSTGSDGGVSTRPGAAAPLHGAGLSLYHIKAAALSAEVLSANAPTAIGTVFDTHGALPEKSLQSGSGARPSNSNLPATLAAFARQSGPKAPRLYHGSPARILARLLYDHIIQTSNDGSSGARWLREVGGGLGLGVSLRTAQRILSGEARPAGEVPGGAGGTRGRRGARPRPKEDFVGVSDTGPALSLGEGEVAAIGEVLRRAARSRYLEVGGLAVEERPGVIILKARIYEPEEEYE